MIKLQLFIDFIRVILQITFFQIIIKKFSYLLQTMITILKLLTTIFFATHLSSLVKYYSKGFSHFPKATPDNIVAHYIKDLDK